MKTKRGYLSLEIDYNSKHYVRYQPINEMIWMNKKELCELFDINEQTMDTHMDMILKTNPFRINEICKSHIIANTKTMKIRYEPYEYNFEMVIMLAFSLKSPQAEVLRKWFIEEFLKLEMINISFTDRLQYHHWD